MVDNDLLTFDGEMVSGPSTADLIVRDDEDVLVAGVRRKNAESVWTIRGYDVYGDGIEFNGLDVPQAHLAAMIVERFDGDDLQMRSRFSTVRPVADGVPAVVAVDGKPAIAAWLFVDGTTRGEIAQLMGVSRDTVTEYLSRFRRRGDGLPDGLDLPAIDEPFPEVPRELRHPEAEDRLVADGGGRHG